MTLVLDSGAFIAVERGDREIAALIAREHRAGRVARTHGGIVAQVWRGEARQSLVARLLAGTDVAPLDEALGRRSGVLLARCKRADVVDAALVLLAGDDDEILTSDPGDLAALAAASGIHVEIVSM